jgi:hypothetical protein
VDLGFKIAVPLDLMHYLVFNLKFWIRFDRRGRENLRTKKYMGRWIDQQQVAMQVVPSISDARAGSPIGRSHLTILARRLTGGAGSSGERE